RNTEGTSRGCEKAIFSCFNEPGKRKVCDTMPHANHAHRPEAVTRRDALKLAGSAALAAMTGTGAAADQQPANRAKRVIVVGAGIGGLCCAYELRQRGHDVTVLEAAGRTGGHVKTIRDPLPDGLYADVGAEHFTRPGYTQYWKYVEHFKLPFLAYPRRVN